MTSHLVTMADIPLFVRSHYSLLDGSLSPGSLCRAAAARGYRYVGLIDRRGFHGLPEFVREAEHVGVVPLTGVCFPEHGVTLLCRTPEGFSRANEIVGRVSAAGQRTTHPERFSRYRRLTGYEWEGERYDLPADLREHGWEGLVVLSTRPNTLAALADIGHGELYAALYHGRPTGKLASWAVGRGIGVFALTDATWLEAEDVLLHRVLKTIGNAGGAFAAGVRVEGESMPLPEAVSAGFAAFPGAVAAAVGFAKQSDAGKLFRQGYHFPRFRGLTRDEEYRVLRGKCFAGLNRRYGCRPPQALERLERELSVIRRKGFSGYFLVVEDIVRRCPRTCGRGSAAASIVSYLLGMTHVDPLRHALYFERFLNEGRRDPPDIDIDFPWDERHEVLGYVFRTYPGRSGMVADHITFGPRSCLREGAKALGYPREEIDRFSTFRYLGNSDAIPRDLRRLSARLRGVPRHIGTHPGGVVITPGCLRGHTHLQLSPLGLPVIAWEKEGAADAGLVKIDLLGNRSLSVLRDTIDLVNRGRRRPIRWAEFDPVDDSATKTMIAAGDTLGVFYIESPATRRLLRKMRCGDFAHLVVATSIIRPAAKRFVEEYVRRLHGGEWRTLHPRLSVTLRETFGIMVYQEDVSRVAMALCGYGSEEADGLRKALSRRDRERHIGGLRSRFFSCGRRQGVDTGTLAEVWEMVRSFDGYSFCKAHSASYALLSYRLAWMKRHYPLPFMVSVLNNEGGYYRKQVYLNSVRRMGYAVLPPDVNRSEPRFTVEGMGIRVGLLQIGGIPVGFVEDVIENRTRLGPFGDYGEFLERTRVDYTTVRKLVLSGSLDGVAGDLSRPGMLWVFSRRGGGELFDATQVPVGIGPYPRGKGLLDERLTLGLSVSCHPVTPFLEKAQERRLDGRPRRVDTRLLHRHAGRRISIVCSLAAGKEVEARAGGPMCFLSLEDPYDIFDAVAFPPVYRKIRSVLASYNVYVAVGRVEAEYGVLQLNLECLWSA